MGELWAGEGTVLATNITRDSVADQGNGTVFSADDQNKRIVIAGTIYVIKTVLDARTITLHHT
jgi:hypothetical protein